MGQIGISVQNSQAILQYFMYTCTNTQLKQTVYSYQGVSDIIHVQRFGVHFDRALKKMASDRY